MIGHELGGQGIGAQFLAGEICFVFSTESRLTLGPPSFLSSGYLGLFLWGMELTDHSTPSSAEVNS